MCGTLGVSIYLALPKVSPLRQYRCRNKKAAMMGMMATRAPVITSVYRTCAPPFALACAFHDASPTVSG
jgi:hypothetical protein